MSTVFESNARKERGKPMRTIFRYRKFIGLTVSISIFLLYFPPSPARSALIATEHVIQQKSEPLSDRARLKAFLARADVMAHLQAKGIRCEEALSRVDSLTDREIALIAGRMDQIPEAAGNNYEFDGSLLAIIGVAIYAIFMAIAIYFSRTMDTEEKPQPKEAKLNGYLPSRPLTEPEAP
jgi:hypothetical protein